MGSHKSYLKDGLINTSKEYSLDTLANIMNLGSCFTRAVTCSNEYTIAYIQRDNFRESLCIWPENFNDLGVRGFRLSIHIDGAKINPAMEVIFCETAPDTYKPIEVSWTPITNTLGLSLHYRPCLDHPEIEGVAQFIDSLLGLPPRRDYSEPPHNPHPPLFG